VFYGGVDFPSDIWHQISDEPLRVADFPIRIRTDIGCVFAGLETNKTNFELIEFLTWHVLCQLKKHDI